MQGIEVSQLSILKVKFLTINQLNKKNDIFVTLQIVLSPPHLTNAQKYPYNSNFKKLKLNKSKNKIVENWKNNNSCSFSY
jgi:hypothetical protein